MAHYNASSFICEKCGRDHGPAISQLIKEGRVRTETVSFLINPRAASKIEFK